MLGKKSVQREPYWCIPFKATHPPPSPGKILATLLEIYVKYPAIVPNHPVKIHVLALCWILAGWWKVELGMFVWGKREKGWWGFLEWELESPAGTPWTDGVPTAVLLLAALIPAVPGLFCPEEEATRSPGCTVEVAGRLRWLVLASVWWNPGGPLTQRPTQSGTG